MNIREMKQVGKENTDFIEKLENHYKGKLTHKANFLHKDIVAFLINEGYPIKSKDSPRYKSLIERWRKRLLNKFNHNTQAISIPDKGFIINDDIGRVYYGEKRTKCANGIFRKVVKIAKGTNLTVLYGDDLRICINQRAITLLDNVKRKTPKLMNASS